MSFFILPTSKTSTPFGQFFPKFLVGPAQLIPPRIQRNIFRLSIPLLSSYHILHIFIHINHAQWFLLFPHTFLLEIKLKERKMNDNLKYFPPLFFETNRKTKSIKKYTDTRKYNTFIIECHVPVFVWSISSEHRNLLK